MNNIVLSREVKVIAVISLIAGLLLYVFAPHPLQKEYKAISKQFIAYNVNPRQALNLGWQNIPDNKRVKIKKTITKLIDRGLLDESLLELKEFNLLSDREMGNFVFLENDRIFKIDLDYNYGDECKSLDDIKVYQRSKNYEYKISVFCPHNLSNNDESVMVNVLYSMKEDDIKIMRSDIFIYKI